MCVSMGVTVSEWVCVCPACESLGLCVACLCLSMGVCVCVSTWVLPPFEIDPCKAVASSVCLSSDSLLASE